MRCWRSHLTKRCGTEFSWKTQEDYWLFKHLDRFAFTAAPGRGVFLGLADVEQPD
jgi:hypothetical protein